MIFSGSWDAYCSYSGVTNSIPSSAGVVGMAARACLGIGRAIILKDESDYYKQQFSTNLHPAIVVRHRL